MPSFAAAPAASAVSVHSQEELQRRIVELLQNQRERKMGAKELINQIQEKWSVDRESIRRAMLSLSADGRTAYTSDWDIFLTGKS